MADPKTDVITEAVKRAAETAFLAQQALEEIAGGQTVRKSAPLTLGDIKRLMEGA